MYQVHDLAGDGAHGSVYRGTDPLGRDVAIKIIRQSVGNADFVFDQGKALARIDSAHVVQVHTVADVIDPVTNQKTPAIIMPWLEGPTLDKFLTQAGELAPDTLKRLGMGMILGMKAIHDVGLVHGDLHHKNVMVCGNETAKIIDILYYDTLAEANTSSKESQLRNDRNALRAALAALLAKVSVPDSDAFSRSLTPESSLNDIHSAFVIATTVKNEIDINQSVQDLLGRIVDSTFIEGDEYAEALSDEIDDRVIRPLIEAMIVSNATRHKHRPLLQILWDRLPPKDQQHIGIDLSSAINREVPKGSFGPHVIMLGAFGAVGWKTLTKATAMRLERALTNDILLGRYSRYFKRLNGGALGTFTRRFFPRFRNTSIVIDNIVQKLNGDSLDQDYIGEHFLLTLPRFAPTEADKERLVQAIAVAADNGAESVIRKLDKLPKDWQRDVEKLRQLK